MLIVIFVILILFILNIIWTRFCPIEHLSFIVVRNLESAANKTSHEKFTSPTSVRRWQESANIKLEELKSQIDEIPERPGNPGSLLIV